MEIKEAIKPDYSKPWVRGEEYICQEGTEFWRRLREERDWTMDDVELLTDGMVTIPAQMIFEDYPGQPDLHELVALAVIYDTSPGKLLDDCYESKGREIMEDED